MRWRIARILASVTISAALAGYLLWTYTSVGCVPNPLPHWLPASIQTRMEIRCHA